MVYFSVPLHSFFDVGLRDTGLRVLRQAQEPRLVARVSKSRVLYDLQLYSFNEINVRQQGYH